MVNVKDAVAAATKYFKEIFTANYSNLMLEEVELTEDEKYWLITLGFDIEFDNSQFFNGLPLIKNTKRQYKILKVDVNKGDIKSMKIRQL